MTQLFVNSSEQWDTMYVDRQRTRRENHELKSVIGDWALTWYTNVDRHTDEGRK